MSETNTVYCTICKTEKAMSEFSASQLNRTMTSGRCRRCLSQRYKERRAGKRLRQRCPRCGRTDHPRYFSLDGVRCNPCARLFVVVERQKPSDRDRFIYQQPTIPESGYTLFWSIGQLLNYFKNPTNSRRCTPEE